jgi:DNA polymerase (family 10)
VSRLNDEVAAALEELADLMVLSGGDQFRVRAYQKAARSIAGYPRDIAQLEPAELDAIPNVGPRLAEKIMEFRSKGTIDQLEELRAQVPAGLRNLLTVPGLGPKRARQVYEELGITSVPELLEALHDHRLRRLKGWGPHTEENLRRAIAQVQASGGRIQLNVALDLAESVLSVLGAVPGVRDLCCAGSLRRMRETVGDIDILVTADDDRPVLDTFGSMRLTDAVLAKGHATSTIFTTKGIPVDLRVVDPPAWGAALMCFTGSKAHNLRVHEMAARQGLRLSEHGLFRVKDNRLLASLTEEEVYDQLGLSWIPPTLREDRGEIEAAQAGRLPQVVEVGDLQGDLHMHTNLTDGVASLEEMVSTAKQRGYRYCAITDHAPLLYMQRMTKEKALAQRTRLRQLEAAAGLTLLHGSELNIQPDGSLDWDDEFLAGFDILVASVHSSFGMPRRQMTQRLIKAMQHPAVNIVGHPTGRIIGRRPAVDVDIEQVFRAAVRTGTALEINSFPDRLDLNDDLAHRARDLGVRFAISSDAHATIHLANVRFGVATAQRGWVEPAQVINTWDLAELRSFVAKKRTLRVR